MIKNLKDLPWTKTQYNAETEFRTETNKAIVYIYIRNNPEIKTINDCIGIRIIPKPGWHIPTKKLQDYPNTSIEHRLNNILESLNNIKLTQTKQTNPASIATNVVSRYIECK